MRMGLCIWLAGWESFGWRFRCKRQLAGGCETLKVRNGERQVRVAWVLNRTFRGCKTLFENCQKTLVEN